MRPENVTAHPPIARAFSFGMDPDAYAQKSPNFVDLIPPGPPEFALGAEGDASLCGSRGRLCELTTKISLYQFFRVNSLLYRAFFGPGTCGEQFCRWG